MSEQLRHKLVSRLQASEKQLSRDKTPISNRVKLIPKLNLVQIRSSSALRRNEKLDPISPFLTRRFNPIATERFERDERADRTPVLTPHPPEASASFKRKTLQQPISKLKPIHLHGDSTFSSTTTPNLTAFLTKLKESNDLQDDFWYFNRGEHMYDLKLSDFKHKNPVDYFTVSYRGVSHFNKGEVQFISLEEWERERYLYGKVKQIPFFHKYRKWKTFSIWMKQRRRNMMEERKAYLRKSLCFLDETLKDLMLMTRQKCYIMMRLDWLDLPNDKVRTLQEFKAEQRHKEAYRNQDIKAVQDSVFNSLKIICAQSTEKFIRSNVTGSILDKDEGISNKVLPFTHEAVIRTHLQLIGRFVRLIDYILVESKITLCVNLYAKMLSYISPRISILHKKIRTVFLIESNFTGMKLNFSPEIDLIKESINKVMNKRVRYICSFKLFAEAYDFSRFVKSLTEFNEEILVNDLEIEQLINRNEEVKSARLEISNCLDRQAEKLEEFSKSWQPYLKQYKNNKDLKISKFKTYGIENLSRVIQKYKKQAGVFYALPDTIDIGIFIVNLKAVKNKLMPSPLDCIEKLQKLLPDLAFERASLLLNEIISINAKLFLTPSNIHEYIAHTELVKQVEEKSDNVALRVLDLKEFIELLENHKMPVSQSLKDKFSEISKLYEQMRNRLSFIYMRAESDKAKFIKILKSEVKNVEYRLEAINNKLENEIFRNKSSNPSDMVEILNDIIEEVEELHQNTHNYTEYQDLLGLPRSNFTDVESMKLTFELLNAMWGALSSWDSKIGVWGASHLNSINVEEVSREVERYYRVALRCKILEEQGNFVGAILQEKVEKLRSLLPIIIDLKSSALKERHMKSIEGIIANQFDFCNNGLTVYKVSDLLASDIHVYREDICEVALKARKEEELEIQLQSIIQPWNSLEFQFKYDKDKELYTFTEIDLILGPLEESQVQISSILTNRYIGDLYGQVDKWNKKFGLFAATIEEWLICQKKWSELEKIFTSADISRQIHEKVKKFNLVNNGFKDLMRNCYRNPVAIVACTQEGLLSKLKIWNQTLEALQKDLDDYLERKRKQFYRFFFISNQELIHILCNVSNHHAIQSLLKNMFEGIHKLNHKEDSDDIESMVSSEGEAVSLPRNTKTRGRPEEWLENLERSMRSALKYEMKNCLKNSAMAKKEWIHKYPVQALCVVDQLLFTSGTQDSISSSYNSLDDWLAANMHYLEEMSKLAKTQLSFIKKRAVVALITQQVHNRDIVERLLAADVGSIGDFLWQQQLRYFFDVDNNDVIIRQVNSSFTYGYEYLGACSRLIITPLTERCFLTITGALHIKLGAAPSGPAGTGKTETTKDLAKCFGKFCIVFNCSEQVTYKMTERLFEGLCYTGSWTCLDEFNRIDIEVLSVIASQILSIRNAKLLGKKEFTFEEQTINLIPSMGIFITMNPDYIGRTELPDNLKILFRPVAMMVPDYSLIAEIVLFSEGFLKAKELSIKMTQLYKLCSEQLSMQDHYDFGLRAVKSVLSMAGQIKLQKPKQDEASLLIKAMKDSNLPKLVKDDLELFLSIVQDLFPLVNVPPPDISTIKPYIISTANDTNLEPIPSMIEKTLQLYETLSVRFGVMLVGQAFTGKSTSFHMLSLALNSKDPSSHTSYTILNPKAYSIEELFGNYNEITQDWKDGIASKIIREANGIHDINKKWVVFDGPVDSMWIENLNTVLDDNRMLCLGNGERIKLKQNMSILFEVNDLASASPATVSRCGMIYYNIDTLPYKCLIVSWVNSLDSWKENQKDHVSMLFTTYLDKILKFFRKNMNEAVTTVDNSLVSAVTNIISAIISSGSPRLADEFLNFKKLVEKVFVFAIAWGIGGALDSRSSVKFDQLVSSELTLDLPRGSLFGSFVDATRKGGEYRFWESLYVEKPLKINPKLTEIFIETAESMKYDYLIKAMVNMKKHLFISGGSGTGKSSLIKNVLSKLKEKGVITPIYLIFSAQTSVNRTQNAIVRKLEHKRKDLLSGPGTSKAVIVIDDANLPVVQEFGAQPPIELIRTLVDYSIFYDRSRLFLQHVLDTTVICSATPPDAGRQPLPSRFIRHFHVLSLPELSEDNIQSIFTLILNSKKYTGEVAALTSALVGGTINIYSTIIKELLPTPHNSHYLFNLRDISKVVQGVMQGSTRTVNNGEVLVRLWVNEVLRVFADRLTSEGDKVWLNELIVKVLAQFFRRTETYSQIFANAKFFGDFVKGNLDLRDREYEEFPSASVLTKRICEFASEYSAKNKMFEFIPFMDAVEHICKICRVVRLPRSHIMLVGVNGNGKQTLAKLATFICQKQLFSLVVTKNYRLSTFLEDLKNLYKLAGGEKPVATVLLLNDSQITEESFLESVNNLLNNGEVPDLFTLDEVEEIEQSLHHQMEKAPEGIFSEFLLRAKNNINIILCMSPANSLFRQRLRMFPSLVSCCTISWFTPWSESALLSVSKTKLHELGLEELLGTETLATKQSLSNLCVLLHSSVSLCSEKYLSEFNSHIYITPKSYFDMISTFLITFAMRKKNMQNSLRKLTRGIKQLQQTHESVFLMEKQMKEMQPKLEIKKNECEELEAKVFEDSIEANKVHSTIEQEEFQIRVRTAEIQRLQEEAESELNHALPIIDAAIKALDSLNPKDISEIKTFMSPPALVVYTLEAISILLDHKSDWDSIKRMLNLNFIETLKAFPRDNISSKTLKKLRNKIYSNPNFNPEKVGQQNFASKSLCAWVFAIDNYSRVIKDVQPKKEKLTKMNAALQETLQNLHAARGRLEQELTHVRCLESELNRLTKEKEQLGMELSIIDIRLKRSSVLTEGLNDEHIRWKEKYNDFNEKISCLVGDSFIASAFVNYLGAFNAEYRNEIMGIWQKALRESRVKVSDHLKIWQVLSSELQILEWNSSSLPSDSFSIESAMISVYSQKWPLLIDPQQQARKWLIGMGVNVSKLSDKDLMKKLESSMRNGQEILLEDLDEALPGFIDNLLNKHFITEGSHTCVIINDVEYMVHSNFRIYLSTKIQNPHFLPETFIKVCVVNFTVNMLSLKERLLSDVVRIEEPAIEAENIKLIRIIARDQKKLHDIEEIILQSISETSGNILDDAKLITSLRNSKSLSQEIIVRVQQTRETQGSIEKIRKKYLPVAIRGAVLYFTLKNLSKLAHMYQYSLNYFSNIFNDTISAENPSNSIEERITNLESSVTSNFYSIISSGLFTEHHLVFGFMISVSIERHSGIISDNIWNLFLKGSDLLVNKQGARPEFITEKSWVLLKSLEKYPEFTDLSQYIFSNPVPWKSIKSLSDIPEPYKNSPLFHKLVLLKALKEQKLTECIKEYTTSLLPLKQASMSSLIMNSPSKSPILFILKSGVDPLRIIEKLARTNEADNKIDYVSLGKGQGDKALKIIESAYLEERWVVLQNCHLARSWMTNLEEVIEKLEASPPSNFRLFLTSLPCDYFPINILHSCVKISLEHPSGIKSNILKSLPIAIQDPKPSEINRVLICLCLFHSVIQERSKFGSLGWNIRYAFNESDLETSVNYIQMLTEEDQLPWDALRFIIGEINYGGRVTDEWDRRLLLNLLDQYLNPTIIEQEYLYEGMVSIPNVTDVKKFKDDIRGISDENDIEIYGLHPTALVDYQIMQAEKVLGDVRKMQSIVSIAKNFQGNSIEVAAKAIIEKLPKPIMNSEIGGVGQTRLKSGVLDPTLVFLTHEISRFNKLLNIARNQLVDLTKALKGQIIMSEDLENLLISLSFNKVPELWLKVSYSSLKSLMNYIEDLIIRVNFFRNWLKAAPIAYKLSYFFFPQGFLTAILQTYSRKYLIPIDKLIYSFDFLSTVSDEPGEGVYIEGLYMEGCRWDFDSMELEEPSGVLAKAPIIHFIPTQIIKQFQEDYSMPVYKNKARSGQLTSNGNSTNFIVAIDTPTSRKSQHWVMRSAAYICEES